MIGLHDIYSEGILFTASCFGTIVLKGHYDEEMKALNVKSILVYRIWLRFKFQTFLF